MLHLPYEVVAKLLDGMVATSKKSQKEVGVAGTNYPVG